MKEEAEVRDEILSMTTEIEKLDTVKNLRQLEMSINNMSLSEDDKKELGDCIADITDIIDPDSIDFNSDKIYSFSITKQMAKYTMSINGNEDREYINGYIENMRSKDAYAYRTYVNDNTPGVNLKIKVNVPQSDGGGTFDTFLGIDDYVFGNI